MAAGTTASGPGGTPPGRAACEAFWAAVGAGPSIQEPGAAWNWANSQNATGAWEAAAKAAVDANPAAADADPMFEQAYMDVQKVLDKALGTEEEDGTGGGIASEVWLLAHQRDGARAERDRLRNACKHMGSVIVSMSRQMECARIEMLQNGPERAMQWILNGLPDVDDNPPGMRWDGKESADEWFERTADYARPEAAK